MSSFSDYRKFLETFACSHVNDGFMEDNGERMLGYFMNLKGSSLFEVKELKDKCNGLYRQNYFDRAAACYDEACKLLGLSIGVIEGEDVQSISDIAVSLNSNLAACALKLEEYQAAVDLCTMILDTFPRNVKALFRRAMAFTKLKRFSEAKSDLSEALVVEPGNKDVLRELAVVKGHLLMKDNGKRVLEVGHVVDVDIRNCKKHIHVSESCTSFKELENVNMEVSVDQNYCGMDSDMRKEEKERVNLEVMDVGSCDMDLGSSLKKKNEYVPVKSILKFSKKGGGNSRLRIPGQSYQKLLDGRELSFYHNKDLSITTIRILNIEATKKRDTVQEIYKKKRRRRRSPKSETSKTVENMEEDKSSFNIINVEPTSRASSSASPLSDNVICSDTHILQIPFEVVAPDSTICRMTDNAPLLCPKAHYGSNDQEPSLLSTSPEKCKMFYFPFDNFKCGPSTPLFCRYPFNHHVKEKKKRRIFTSKKDYSQEDESPRRILSTCPASRSFSRKFLRLCGVSVSCCRYSSGAQFVKKRKEMFAQLASCDRPLKKPTLIVNPILSFIAFSNNVIIKPDSESRV